MNGVIKRIEFLIRTMACGVFAKKAETNSNYVSIGVTTASCSAPQAAGQIQAVFACHVAAPHFEDAVIHEIGYCQQRMNLKPKSIPPGTTRRLNL
jgi:hypothetical protein